jgi:hypothetical protein
MNLPECSDWLRQRNYKLICRLGFGIPDEYEVINPDHWSKKFNEKDLTEWVNKEAHKEEIKYVNFMNSMA